MKKFFRFPATRLTRIKPFFQPYIYHVPHIQNRFFQNTQPLPHYTTPLHQFNAIDFARRNISIQIDRAIQYIGFIDQLLCDHHLYLQRSTIIHTDNGKPILVAWKPGYGSSYFYIANLNMMMQGRFNERKNQFNNAYKLIEDDVHYQERISQIFESLGRIIKKYQAKKINIPILCFEEAPIKEEDIIQIQDHIKQYFPENFTPWIHTTSWGNMIIINKNDFPFDIQTNPTVYDGLLYDMNTRLTTLAFTQHDTPVQTTLTNLHLPHDHPETALELLTHNMVHHILQKLANKEFQGSMIYIGDWNLPSESVEKLIYDKLNNTFPDYFHMDVDITITTSPSGHLKTNQDIVTVDHAICIHYAIIKEFMNLDDVQRWADTQLILLTQPSTPASGLK